MTSQRGVALILALMVLAFLTVLGGALLTTTTIDIRISDNFKTGVQSLYVAEAGIEQAREFLRTSSSSPTQLLTTAAERPLISGELVGHYDVWLRNDNADGPASRIDTNDVLTLLSIGRIANAQKIIEVTVRKATVNFSDPILLARITANANDVFNPPAGLPQPIANYGSPGNYRIVVVNGDVNLGWGSGYGILLANGSVVVEGSFTWNGFIIVTNPGALQWNTADGLVNGAVFVGQTKILESWIHDDPSAIAAANKLLPYIPIAIRER
jgi:Tfp pilus assembly protein PilX